MTAKLTQPKTYFPNLDGLRTLACLAVFGFHGFLTIAPRHSETPRAFRYFSSGHLGVNFFYVLSGFLITYLLLEEEQQRQRIDLLGFYRRRVLRIWPLFYACVAYGFIGLPLLLHLARISFHETASPWLHLVFLGNLDSVWKGEQPAASSLAVLWSVAIEEQFYLLWPVLLMFLVQAWRPAAFLLVIGGATLFRFFHSGEDFLLYRHSLAVVSDMGMGGAAAWVCFRYPGVRQYIAGLSRFTITAVYLIALMGAVLAPRLLPATAGASAAQRLVCSALFVWVILEQNYATRSWVKVQRLRWLTYWGTFTYGFYCLHPIVLEGLQYGSEYWHFVPSASNTLVRVAIGLPLSAGLAWLSYHYWEKPFLQLKDRRKPAPERPNSSITVQGSIPLAADIHQEAAAHLAEARQRVAGERRAAMPKAVSIYKRMRGKSRAADRQHN